jgi:transposase-like protein
MEKKQRRRYSAGFKEQVIRRMQEGERVKALSHEFLIAPSVLFSWRQEAEERPGGEKYEAAKRKRAGEEQALEARIAELEAAVGRTMLERDFLAGALRRIGVTTPASESAGKKTSGPRSTGRWNRKAN